jgi:L-phenylalanine/L-methionine N-acetyltransferase
VAERLDVLVREPRPDDIPAINVIHNQRAVAIDTLQIPYQTDAERAAQWLSSPTQRFIVADAGGRVVGLAGLTLYTRRRAHAGAIGMGVDEHVHGRGVGTTLLEALLDLADNWYNLRRLELQVYTDNHAGIRLYQRAGFEIEGTHRAYAYRDGVFSDAHAMARLRNEPAIALPAHADETSSHA